MKYYQLESREKKGLVSVLETETPHLKANYIVPNIILCRKCHKEIHKRGV